MAASVRGGGLVAGRTSCQATPSHIHVSSSGVPPVPLKSSNCLEAASYAIAAPIRPAGLGLTSSCDHVVPFQIQVSPRATPLPLKVSPPKSTSCPVAPSYAIVAPERGGTGPSRGTAARDGQTLGLAAPWAVCVGLVALIL